MTGTPPDLAAVVDADLAAEFATCDLDATMATMTDAPLLTQIPVMTGGQGSEEVRHFYGEYFILDSAADVLRVGENRAISRA